MQRNAELGGRGARILEVLRAGAVVVVVFPVAHVEPVHVVAGALQQQRGDRGVDAAGHADDDSFAGELDRHGADCTPRARDNGPQACYRLTTAAHLQRGLAGRDQATESSGWRLPRRKSSMQRMTSGERRRAACASSLLGVSQSARTMPLSSGCCGVMIVDRAAEGEAQEAAAVERVAPQVGADQRLGMEAPGGLLAGLADHRFDQGFPVFEVPGGLIEHQAAGDPLLDQQESRRRVRRSRRR